MREIKFRAWDTLREEYLSAGQVILAIQAGKNPKTIHYLDLLKYPDDYKDRFILEQYTGLKDKNGKEIYEGDIVKYKEWFNGFGDNYTDMEWIAEMECNKFDNETSGGADGDIWYTDIEIIGNIHTGEDK